MRNYCPNCDQEHEFDCEMKVSLLRKAQEVWYTCQNCKGGFSYKPDSPPPERMFEYDCPHCEKPCAFTWHKDWSTNDHKGWNFYQCVACGCVMNLPETEKERKKYREWQKAGCPPPWWFRPTQVAVLLILAALVYFFPWWMLGIYLAGCYSLAGYMLIGKQMIAANVLSGLIFWLLAPLTIPLLIIFFAIRLPIL